ncbi:hypothetical protein [Brachymonas denitrificans]|uniref:hypothetical protein n=1 Tax=Brachymonas denitrificans TaxID=28220 RepID=UPI001BD0F9DF|nr:hypothetical protein [Brachymonas denitrificans]
MSFINKKVAAFSALTLGAVSSAMANTQLDTVFGAIDLSGLETKVGALAVAIVGIALVMKGPDIAKRIISKV